MERKRERARERERERERATERERARERERERERKGEGGGAEGSKAQLSQRTQKPRKHPSLRSHDGAGEGAVPLAPSRAPLHSNQSPYSDFTGAHQPETLNPKPTKTRHRRVRQPHQPRACGFSTVDDELQV